MNKAVRSDADPNSIGDRLKWLCLGWGFVIVAYGLSHHLQRPGHILPTTVVDIWFTYNVHAVWAYASFFIFIPMAYFKCHPSQVKSLAHGMQLCALIAGAVYLVYPTTMVFPEWDFSSTSGWVMRLLVAIDSPQNCAPSLHVALSILATLALCHRAPRGQQVFFILWMLCIVCSVIVLKRHMFIDVVTGVMLALGVVYVGRIRERGKSNEKRSKK